MNKIKYIIGIISIAIGFASCNAEDILKDPIIHEYSVSLNADTVGSIATFTMDVDAEYISFWNGMEDYNYYGVADEVEPLIGFPVEEKARMKIENRGNDVDPDTKTFTVVYKEVGTFKAVLITRNVQDYTGEYLEQIGEVVITIVE